MVPRAKIDHAKHELLLHIGRSKINRNITNSHIHLHLISMRFASVNSDKFCKYVKNFEKQFIFVRPPYLKNNCVKNVVFIK